MKVKELIEKLKEFDQELPVALFDYVKFAGGRITAVNNASLQHFKKWKNDPYAEIDHSDVDGEFVMIE